VFADPSPQHRCRNVPVVALRLDFPKNVQDHSRTSGNASSGFFMRRPSIGHPAGPCARTNHALSHVDKLAASRFVDSAERLWRPETSTETWDMVRCSK
jgi:hypothetical protein